MISIGGIDLNGAEAGTSKFLIDPEDGFDIGAPPPKWEWVERRIGSALVPSPSTPLLSVELPVLCLGDSADDIAVQMGDLRAACDDIAPHAAQGGTEVEWRALGATYGSTLLCMAAEIGPVRIARDDARMNVARFKVTLTCQPWLLGPWSTVATGRKPTGVPAKEVQISSLSGDIPGPARITLTNQGSTAQRFALLGLDGRGYASGNKLVLLPSTFDCSTAPLNGTYTAPTNEVQTATKSGTISGGTFTLTYEGQTTSALAYNATTATVQTALEALSTIGTGNITVGGSALSSGNMTFTFTGDLAGTDLSLIVLNSSLTGGGSAPITQTTQGVSGYVANTSLQSSFSDFFRTGNQTDTGSFQLWALVYTDADQNNARIRASISIGDTGSAVINRSATIPAKNAQVWVNLGPVHAKKRVSSGSYRWNATIGAMTVGTVGTDVRVMRIAKVPTDLGVGIVKTPQNSSYTLVASDDFNQTAGPLTGKTADLGGAWSGGGDADDFTVDDTNHRVQRTAVSDTSGTGRYVVTGTSLTECAAELMTSPQTSTALGGIVFWFTDANNFAVAYLETPSLFGANLVIRVRVAGTNSILAQNNVGYYTGLHPLVLVASPSDVVSCDWGTNNISVSASSLSAAGLTLSGKCGIYDEWTSATPSTRTYDNFRAYSIPAMDAAAHPSRRLAWQPDGTVEREASGGTYFGYAAGQQRTGTPLLDPSGTNRLLVASADFNPDSAGSTAQNVPLDYTVEHRPAFAIGRH